jgi:hypothetical protein
MKKLLGLLLPFCISCQNHDFDLAHLRFPITKDTLTQRFELTENLYPALNRGFYTRYETSDENALYFDRLSLSGKKTKNEDSFSSVTFYEDKETKKIDAYAIGIELTDKTLALEKLLEKKLGETDYYYRNKDFSFRIWESQDKLYFFETNSTGVYYGKNFIACTLYVVNPDYEIFYKNLGGGFSYYKN